MQEKRILRAVPYSYLSLALPLTFFFFPFQRTIPNLKPRCGGHLMFIKKRNTKVRSSHKTGCLWTYTPTFWRCEHTDKPNHHSGFMTGQMLKPQHVTIFFQAITLWKGWSAQACSFPQPHWQPPAALQLQRFVEWRASSRADRCTLGRMHATENHPLSLIRKMNSQVSAAAARACPQACIYPLAIEHVYNLCWYRQQGALVSWKSSAFL